MATVWQTAVHLAVAGGVFDGVFCAVLYPLHEIWDVIESVYEGFLTYFASSTREAENRTRWKRIVANSSVVPDDLPRL